MGGKNVRETVRGNDWGQIVRGMIRGKFLGGCPWECPGRRMSRGNCPGKRVRGNFSGNIRLRICGEIVQQGMSVEKRPGKCLDPHLCRITSLRAAVVICAILVNTQTNTHTHTQRCSF